MVHPRVKKPARNKVPEVPENKDVPQVKAVRKSAEPHGEGPAQAPGHQATRLGQKGQEEQGHQESKERERQSLREQAMLRPEVFRKLKEPEPGHAWQGFQPSKVMWEGKCLLVWEICLKKFRLVNNPVAGRGNGFYSCFEPETVPAVAGR